MSKIEITNKYVCKFYNDHPSVRIEDVNIMIVKLFETALQQHTTSASATDVENSMNISNILSPLVSGELGELKLELLLNKLNPTASIMRRNKNGDFLIARHGRQSILIEGKESNKNISEHEVNSFIKNTREENGCHGILISQHTGIETKQNYHIDICGGSILVYLHSAEYDPEKIKTAIDIIDNLSAKLKELNITDTNSSTSDITKEMIYDINKEYQLFITQKETITQYIKETSKTLLNHVDDMKFSCLDKFLSSKIVSAQKVGVHRCSICKLYTSNTLKGIAAHKRGCSKKHVNKD
jgi:hypothetical protein